MEIKKIDDITYKKNIANIMDNIMIDLKPTINNIIKTNTKKDSTLKIMENIMES